MNSGSFPSTPSPSHRIRKSRSYRRFRAISACNLPCETRGFHEPKAVSNFGHNEGYPLDTHGLASRIFLVMTDAAEKFLTINSLRTLVVAPDRDVELFPEARDRLRDRDLARDLVVVRAVLFRRLKTLSPNDDVPKVAARPDSGRPPLALGGKS